MSEQENENPADAIAKAKEAREMGKKLRPKPRPERPWWGRTPATWFPARPSEGEK